MLNCREVTRLFSESQERKLKLKERMGLNVHVMMCEGCRRFGEQMSALRHIARSYAKGGHGSIPENPDK